MTGPGRGFFITRVLSSILLLSWVAAAWGLPPPVAAAGHAGDPFCTPMPPSSGKVVTVSTEAQLWQAVNTAPAGTTIQVADGIYHLGQNGYYVWLDTPGVTLRSISGNRDAVVFDDNYSGTEIVTIAASDVTIADLTLRRAGTHAVHVVSTDSGATLNTRIYNLHIIDPGQQAIKINPHAARQVFPDDGEVACTHMELSDPGREMVWEINGSCYTGGIDGHWSRDWVVRDNTIEGFWCRSGLSEHAVHFWTGSRDTLVERNTLVDNARAIGFGLVQSGNGRTYPDSPCQEAVGYVDHYGGIIRNNTVFADRPALFQSQYGVDTGIALWQACGAQVLHNSVAFTDTPFSAIEWRFANTRAWIVNNLATHSLRARDSAPADLIGNLEGQPLSLFADGAGGNLHLAPDAVTAIDQGAAVAEGMCDDDMDGDTRLGGTARDVGADELTRIRASGQNGAWHQAATWVGDFLPTPLDTVHISPQTSVTVEAEARCLELQLASEAMLSLIKKARLDIGPPGGS